MPKKEKKPPTAEEIAEMLGVAAEKTFKVEQDHIPKEKKEISMKVGGMGIQFINKKGVNVDSFLYTNVVGWKYSRSDETLHIELGQTKADGREANIEKEIGIKTPDGEEIGLLMREHAQKVAKTIKLEKKEKAAAEEKRLQEAVGTYRIENPVTCREGAAFDSAQTVQLEIGDVIEVTEAAIATQKEPDDTTRLKCEKGWLSLKPHLCVKLDADGNPIEPEGAKKIELASMDSVSSGSLPVSTGTEVDDLAEELGMLGEETFTVKQSHIKKNPVSGAKVPKEVTLKVGGMGLNIFDGGIPVENHLYFALQGWTYSQERNTFDITLKAGSKKIKFVTPEGEKIAQAMKKHTQTLADQKKQDKAERKAEEAAAKEAEEEAAAEAEAAAAAEALATAEFDDTITDDMDGDELLGFWQAQNPILVREGLEVASDEVGKLERGDVIKVVEVQRNSADTVRLRSGLGWVSFKSHLVRKLGPSYEPGEAEVAKVREVLERTLLVYQCMDDDQQTEVEEELASRWADVFGSGGGGGGGEGGGVSAKKVTQLNSRLKEALAATEEKAARCTELEAQVSSLQEAASEAAASEGGQATELLERVSELEKKLADDAAAAEKAAAVAAEEKEDAVAELSGKNATLEAQVKKLQADLAEAKQAAKSAGGGGGGGGAAAGAELPADVQAIFDKANAADASNDKPTALREYQTGVKKAMAYMKANPSTKKTLTPILQKVMKRAQELKAEIAAAKATPPSSPTAGDDAATTGEEEDPLPAEVRALINKAKEADTPGNEAAAIALFENSAKQAMAFLRANPAKKAELTPTLQALIMRTRALKQELKSAE